MTTETYQGWTNYETWAVNLWIGDDEPQHRFWTATAAERKAEAPDTEQVKAGTWTAEEAARFTLADQLKDTFEDGAEEAIAYPCLWADLLGAALAKVNWAEIAAGLLGQ